MESKTIRIRFSDENTAFFTELLTRDNVEIISDDETDTEFELVTYEYLESVLNQIDKLKMENATFRLDFLNPLAQIKGYVDILILGKAGKLTQEQEKYLKIVSSLSQQLLEQVHALRDS